MANQPFTPEVPFEDQLILFRFFLGLVASMSALRRSASIRYSQMNSIMMQQRLGVRIVHKVRA